jgi:hypothetical protein
MNSVRGSRSRSGDAWDSCSSIRRAGSILGLTVIVVSFFESVVRDRSKDHPMTVAYVSATRSPGSIHHSAGRNPLTLNPQTAHYHFGTRGG